MGNLLTIKSFENSLFGHLTCLKSEKTGTVMFIAKEVCDLWGHKNSRQAIKAAKLLDSEILVVNKSANIQFFTQLSNLKLLGGRASSIQLITESGLYKLVMKSDKKAAEGFQNWVTMDVLPSIRKTGKYVMGSVITNIGDHQKVSIQKGNSKDVNAVNYQNGGVENIIEYNRMNCKAVTGKEPKEIKTLGLQFGLKKSECSSSKEVLRRMRPELACTMSFIDNGVKQGQSFDKLVEIGNKYAAPLFKAMLETGMRPGELSM